MPPGLPVFSRALLEERARLLAGLRAFLDARGLLEADTPLLYPAAPAEPGLDTYAVSMPGGATWYLQPSPEFALKRLLARHPAGLYQLGHVFRRGENGRIHNGEFTMLEWYRPGLTLAGLEAECIDLLQTFLGARPVQRHPLRELFLAHANVDPDRADAAQIREVATTCQAPLQDVAVLADTAQCLDLLFEHRVRPALDPGAITVIHGFPAGQSELAATEADADGVPRALRFEMFHQGMELVNAAVELRDGAEYRRRVGACNAQRRERGLPEVAVDGELAAVLDELPACVGAALGADRLLMCRTGARAIAEVMPFTQDRL